MSNIKQSQIAGLQDQIYHDVYSTAAIKENARNEIVLFQKNNDEFTNMKASGSFPRHEMFWLKGITLDFYNKTGNVIDWNTVTGLRKFVNEAVLDMLIGSKAYIDRMPLRNLIKLPEIAKSGVGEFKREMFILPDAIELEGGMDFRVQVTGVSGAYLADNFDAQTRIEVNLHGMLGRPVQ